MTELVKYDAMCHAIAECHRIDEVKDIHDKARALEIYAEQAGNTEAERKACEIRLRAERRSGELLAVLAKATAQTARTIVNNDGSRCKTEYGDALNRTGLSRSTAVRYQRLADVPKDIFEDALRDPLVRKPTTNGIIKEARDPQLKMPSDSLWFWGRLRDFERDEYFTKNIVDLMEPMTDSMRADVLRILPLMADFFNEAKEVAHEFA